ncbi:hypothetical protein M3Y94_01217500 [Aphelenchoides besseyi]|nr:hypothetical protein M3Y94_01217500 [Aphelenchoides besseyi]KAI6219752.1 hypothetical protein M3Y95_01099900 [Aphelenchoides besseyi]
MAADNPDQAITKIPTNLNTSTPGYGNDLPSHLLNSIAVHVDCPPKTALSVKVNRSIIVSSIAKDSLAFGRLNLGDFVLRVNDRQIETRRDFQHIMSSIAETNKDQTVTFHVKRPTKLRRIDESNIAKFLPPAYEQGSGYEYYLGTVVLYAGAHMGLHIKTYMSKVFVTAVDKDSLAQNNFRIGDAILTVDQEPVWNIQTTTQQMCASLNQRKWFEALLERPQSEAAYGQVQVALKATEKPTEEDLKMSDDVIQLCQEQIERMKALLKVCEVEPQMIGILHTNENVPETTADQTIAMNPVQHPHLTFAAMSEELAIGCDNDPKLLSPVNPKSNFTKVTSTIRGWRDNLVQTVKMAASPMKNTPSPAKNARSPRNDWRLRRRTGSLRQNEPPPASEVQSNATNTNPKAPAEQASRGSSKGRKKNKKRKSKEKVEDKK